MELRIIKVAVLIPVYNTCRNFLVQAFQSLLDQTIISCLNFTLQIIIFVMNDGSTSNETIETLNEYESDGVIKLFHFDQNKGVVHSLNYLILQSLKISPDYIARMDSDDISYKNRLIRQVEFLEQNSDISILGGAVKLFKDGKEESKYIEYPTKNVEIQLEMFFNCSLIHPTIMYRNSIFSLKISRSADLNELTMYPAEYKHCEDYALWIKIITKTQLKFSNLPLPPILGLRKHKGNISGMCRNIQLLSTLKLLNDSLNELETFSPYQRNFNLDSILILSGRKLPTSNAEIYDCERILTIIEKFLMLKFSAGDSEIIFSKISNRIGELAAFEMKMNPMFPPSKCKLWMKFIKRHPESLKQLIGEASTKKALMETSDAKFGLTVLIFTKDRAFQLKEYLRTFDEYLGQNDIPMDLIIIWKASQQCFRDSYEDLKGKTNEFQTSNKSIEWIEEKNFADQILGLVSRMKKFFMFGVDDVIFYRKINLHKILYHLEKSNQILCAHLKLSPNIVYSQPASKKCKNPNLNHLENIMEQKCVHSGDQIENGNGGKDFIHSSTENGIDALIFNRFEGNYDWNYPFDLIATIFRKSTITNCLKLIVENYGIEGISHPNKLEVAGAKLFQKNIHPHSTLSECICLSKPILNVITVNRVQEICKNELIGSQDLLKLNEYYYQKKQYNLDYYRGKKFDSVHIGDFVI